MKLPPFSGVKTPGKFFYKSFHVRPVSLPQIIIRIIRESADFFYSKSSIFSLTESSANDSSSTITEAEMISPRSSRMETLLR